MRLKEGGHRFELFTTGIPNRNYNFRVQSRPSEEEFTYTANSLPAAYPESSVFVDLRRKGDDIFTRVWKIRASSDDKPRYRFSDGSTISYNSLISNNKRHKVEKFIFSRLSMQNYLWREILTQAEKEGLSRHAVDSKIHDLMFTHDLLDFDVYGRVSIHPR